MPLSHAGENGLTPRKVCIIKDVMMHSRAHRIALETATWECYRLLIQG